MDVALFCVRVMGDRNSSEELDHDAALPSKFENSKRGRLEVEAIAFMLLFCCYPATVQC